MIILQSAILVFCILTEQGPVPVFVIEDDATDAQAICEQLLAASLADASCVETEGGRSNG